MTITPRDMSQPCAKWTQDCQGKWDYDGKLLSISSRYWPGGYRADGKPSATSSILIDYGTPTLGDDGEYYVWSESGDLVADTEAAVKILVEKWVKHQMAYVLRLLFPPSQRLYDLGILCDPPE